MTVGSDSSARDLVAAVRAKQISARELLDMQLATIEAVNPTINAVVSLDAERAHEHAAHADQQTARGEAAGALHGLPFAFKDTHEVSGVRTTYGSPLRADNVPRRD
jgi:amidase